MKRHCESSREVASASEKTAPSDYVVALINAAMFWPEKSEPNKMHLRPCASDAKCSR